MPAAKPSTLTPTQDLWAHYQQVFDYFNELLFENSLPQCILNFSTHGRSKAYFSVSRWEKSDKGGKKKITAHEISLNPTLLEAPIEESMSWLVRQMTHLWQWEHGIQKPEHQGYYNKEFVMKLASIGLPASEDGTPEGKRTGFRMKHWINPGGRFDQVMKDMPREYFPWKGGYRQEPKGKKKPTRYTCPACGAWFLALNPVGAICTTNDCNVPYESACTEDKGRE